MKERSDCVDIFLNIPMLEIPSSIHSQLGKETEGRDRPYDTCYNDRPFTWMACSSIFSILNGNKRVFVDTAISMKKENIMVIWDMIMSEKCTNAFLFPNRLLEIIDNLDVILKHGYVLYAIGCEVKVIGGNGETLNRGQLGEICVKSP
ncbi:uncharacterized protein LOC110449389 [Mizuhopecten yessoensis]|uniref:uncharacterized protein LOC110449389 n=1 Tax=Mizuhopecten yessoensis TaxID=6573 RepID=UPI000B45F03F|nr:uncharacterized protein LOC110449389 [Mizuhopecten yessoensis]